MKKKMFLVLFPFIALLAGCNNISDLFFWQKKEEINLDFKEGASIDKANTKGALGDFELLAPGEGAIVSKVPTFSWSALKTPFPTLLKFALLRLSILNLQVLFIQKKQIFHQPHLS